MKYYILNFIAIVILTGIYSCDMDMVIDMDIPEHNPKIVVNCEFTPDSNWVVNISKSAGIIGKKNQKIEFVENANIKIILDGQVLTSPSFTEKGFYVSNENLPLTGRTYIIEVHVPEFEKVSATGMIPHSVKPVNFRLTDSNFHNHNPDFMPDVVKVSFDINDPADIENYYIIQLYQIDTVIGFFNDTDVYIYPVNFYSEDPLLEYSKFLPDRAFNGQTYTVDLLVDKYLYYLNSTLLLHLYSSSKSHFLYSKSRLAQEFSKYDPFAEPVYVYNNIENGFGFFAGFSIYQSSLRLE